QLRQLVEFGKDLSYALRSNQNLLRTFRLRGKELVGQGPVILPLWFIQRFELEKTGAPLEPEHVVLNRCSEICGHQVFALMLLVRVQQLDQKHRGLGAEVFKVVAGNVE